MRHLPLLLAFLLWGGFLPLNTGTGVRAQIGLHPPRADWQRLTTDEGHVLYPAGYEARAQRVANMMHAVYENHRATVGDKLYDFDLVLQTPNTTINGFVSLAPFRSEFFLTPPQQGNLLSNSDWVDLLTIHEFRHVQQISNERRGLTMLWSILFGQPGWVFGGLGTPNWYSEGDAVIMETALTPAGRARTPAFSAGLRALLDENIVYSYPRSRNNSLRRFIPDHYRYGYNSITYGREKFGAEAWTKALQKSAAWSGLWYAFSNRLRKETGLGTRQMYRAAITDLQERQAAELATRGPFVEGKRVPPAIRAVTNYTYPQVDAAGRLLALRSGFQHVPELVVVDPKSGAEEVVTAVGIQREPYVDVRGHYAAWMENRNDPRYTNEGFSDVFIYDLRSGEKRRLSRNQKYFSPSVSPDGSRVVAVEEDEFAGLLQLVILNAATGAVERRIGVDGTSAALPKFSPDGQSIYYYEKSLAGTAIVQLSLNSAIAKEQTGTGTGAGARKVLKAPGYEALGNLEVSPGNQIIYTSGRDGIDNVYRLDPATGKTEQLTNVRIGAEYAHLAADQRLYYSEASSRGLRLRWFDAAAGKSMNPRFPALPGGLRPAAPNVFERPEAIADEVFDLTNVVPQQEYPSEDVSNTLSGIKLHSWSGTGSVVNPGLGLVASNALNTAEVEAVASYNFNEERPRFSVSASYGGFYPVISTGLAYAERRFFTAQLTDSLNLFLNELDQVELNLDAAVPLAWSAGEFFYNVQPSLGLNAIVLRDESESRLPNSFLSGRAGLVAQVLKRRARQQVQSRLGMTTRLDVRKTLSGDDLGQVFQLSNRLWLPGLGRTHGIRLDVAYRSEAASRSYQYIDNFRYARGYSVSFVDRAYRLSANYELPLLHPDLGFLGLYYLQRVRLNAFFDHGRYEFFNLQSDMTSAGVELYFDQVVLNTLPISFGIQYSVILAEDDIQGNRKGAGDWNFTVGQRF